MINIYNSTELEYLLGENIKRIRLLKNIKRDDLATQAGISVTAIKNLESGSGASVKTLIKTLRVLGKEDWLFALAPVASINPMTMLKTKGQRQRARPSKESKE